MDDSHKLGCWGSANEEIMKSQYPLHRACRDGEVETLSLLLMEAQHGVYVEDMFYGWTPAHWAAYFGKLACLRKLTMVGVDCDGCSLRFHQTPGHLAAFGGHPHVLQWLVQAGACLETQDYLGEAAVHKAARCGSIECVSLLVASGAQLHICNNGGLTPAELAVSCGQEECARFLHSASTQKQHTPINGTTTTQQINTAVVMETSALHNSEQNGDCEMEVSESDKVVTNGYSRVGDVTLSHDISVSVTRVAGRKRSWDCGGVAECKRMRRTDLFTYPPPECDAPLLLAQQPHCETLDDCHPPSLVSPPISDISPQCLEGDRRNNASGYREAGCRYCLRWRCECTGHCGGQEPYSDVLALSVKPMAPVVLPTGYGQSRRQEERCYSVFV